MRLVSMLVIAMLFVSVGAMRAALLIVNTPIPHSAPNNRWTVFEAERGLSWDIFLADKLTGQISQLTDHFASDRFPVLSPDSTRVAFVSWRDGNSEVYVLDLQTRAARNVSSHRAADLLAAWSPDGTILAFVSNRDDNTEIYLVDVTRGLQRNLTHHPAHDSRPQWAPDGAHITFKSNRNGKLTEYQIEANGRHPIHLETVVASDPLYPAFTAENQQAIKVAPARSDMHLGRYG